MGLEAAVAELGSLYTVARTFTALEMRAESELLPRVAALGRRLRGLVRRAQLSQADVDAASAEVLSVRAQWRAALEGVRSSAIFGRALAAFAAGEQDELARLLPLIFARLRRVHPTALLYFPLSLSTHRRRPGQNPFLGAAESAERVTEALGNGLAPEVAGSEWWERELPFLSCAETPAAFDGPLTLAADLSDAAIAVFAPEDEAAFRIFTPRLRVPMTPVLAAEASDEWWNAYAESYDRFREALRSTLAARGIEARVCVPHGPTS
jgi:hypothetical protein